MTSAPYALPPMLALHGEADTTCPFAMTETYVDTYNAVLPGGATLASLSHSPCKDTV